MSNASAKSLYLHFIDELLTTDDRFCQTLEANALSLINAVDAGKAHFERAESCMREFTAQLGIRHLNYSPSDPIGEMAEAWNYQVEQLNAVWNDGNCEMEQLGSSLIASDWSKGLEQQAKRVQGLVNGMAISSADFPEKWRNTLNRCSKFLDEWNINEQANLYSQASEKLVILEDQWTRLLDRPNISLTEFQEFWSPATHKDLAQSVSKAEQQSKELCEQARLKREREVQERKERERIERERIRREREEQERKERERLERERLEREAQERKVREQLERERLERERVEHERLEKQRQEQERLRLMREAEERKRQEKIEREKKLKERLEQERLESERLAHEEQERKAREKLDGERKLKERLAQERLELERLEIERKEKQRKEQEKLERQRKLKERLEQERLEIERLEIERLEREQQEQAQREIERLEQERLAEQLALKSRQSRKIFLIAAACFAVVIFVFVWVSSNGKAVSTVFSSASGNESLPPQPVWLKAGLYGHDNSAAALKSVRIIETKAGRYSATITNQFGFSCGIEFDSKGDPAILRNCRSATEPDWKASPKVIEMRCSRLPTEVVCRGKYMLSTRDLSPETSEMVIARRL
jgi:hypothetical protein